MGVEKRFYVYAHYRKTDGQLFYIGKGTRERAFSHHNRNSYWRKIVGKHGFNARIIRDNMTHCCALSLEKIVMAANWHPRMANVSLGGDGAPYHTAETREKISKSRRGKAIPAWAQAKVAKAPSRPIINSDGEVLPSTREACRVLSKRLGKSISSGLISDTLNGKHAFAYNLAWSFDLSSVPPKPDLGNKMRPVLCVDTGEKFETASHAVKALKERRGAASSGQISEALNRGKKAYGFHWKYL